MNIAIGQIVHETNTFSPVIVTEKVFKEWEWIFGQEIIDKHLNVQDYLGGMIDKANELNINEIPTFSAFTRPSGKIENTTLSKN